MFENNGSKTRWLRLTIKCAKRIFRGLYGLGMDPILWDLLPTNLASERTLRCDVAVIPEYGCREGDHQ